MKLLKSFGYTILIFLSILLGCVIILLGVACVTKLGRYSLPVVLFCWLWFEVYKDVDRGVL